MHGVYLWRREVGPHKSVSCLCSPPPPPGSQLGIQLKLLVARTQVLGLQLGIPLKLLVARTQILLLVMAERTRAFSFSFCDLSCMVRVALWFSLFECGMPSRQARAANEYAASIRSPPGPSRVYITPK